MFGISDFGAFCVAFVLLLFLPGPGNLALISSASKGGLAGGLASVLGLLAGDQVLLWLTVAGLAAVLKAYPPVFLVLQWAGAAYLAWLGYKMLTAPSGEGPSIQVTPGHYFRETLLITLLNPKAIMFYLAFFPQFIQAWRSKSVKDVSLAMYIIFCLGISLWLIYGFLVNSLPVILANVVTLSMAAAILYLKIRYR